MQVAIIKTLSFIGLEAQTVRIETHISNGLPKFSMVGLAETAVKESKERVRSALLNSQFEFPNRRITVNLSPAELPKSGSGFDLAIALSILAASKQLPIDCLQSYYFIGELALNGAIRGIKTILPALSISHHEKIIIPTDNANELYFIKQSNIFCSDNLLTLCALLKEKALPEVISPPKKRSVQRSKKDWSDIKGRMQAKRALEIAASGGHHTILNGPPGSGKTMLASRLHTLLPSLYDKQLLETKILQAIANKTKGEKYIDEPPFRDPHHTSSVTAIVGGGHPIKPGEISLAHNGILFLDELPEYRRDILESLREPLESQSITIARASQTIQFPANFQLIAACNPCPCGYLGHEKIACSCSYEQISRYQKKLSGPLLDRIDIFIDIHPLSIDEITQESVSDTSAKVRERVSQAQKRQRQRQGCLNSQLDTNTLKSFCTLDENVQSLLSKAANKLNLSARSYFRVIKLARTIADMIGSSAITGSHISEALMYRLKHQARNTECF